MRILYLQKSFRRQRYILYNMLISMTPKFVTGDNKDPLKERIFF